MLFAFSSFSCLANTAVLPEAQINENLYNCGFPISQKLAHMYFGVLIFTLSSQ